MDKCDRREVVKMLERRGIDYHYSMSGGLLFKLEDGTACIADKAFAEDAYSFYCECSSIEKVEKYLFEAHSKGDEND